MPKAWLREMGGLGQVRSAARSWDWGGTGMGAGPASAGFGHGRFVKDRAHSLLLPWRGAGLREAGRRTNFPAEPLSQNKLLKKSGGMPASSTS